MTNSRHTAESRPRRIMRLWPTMMLALFCMLAFTDCGPSGCTYTLYPIYTEKELYLDDSIVGTWTCMHDSEVPFVAGAILQIRKSKEDSKAYEVEWTNKGKEQYRTELRLARIGNHSFVDFATPKELQGAKMLFPSTRLHAFAELTRYKGIAILGFLVPAALTGIKDKPAPRYETKIDFASPSGTDVVISSPTHDLQQLTLEILANRQRTAQTFESLAFCREGADCELEFAQWSVTQDPADSKAAYRLATLYAERDRFDDAAGAWRRAPAHEERFSDDERHLAWTLIEKRRVEEAVAVVNSGTRGKPYEHDCWLGWLYLKADMPAEAVKGFGKCSGLGSALAFEQSGDFAGARAELEKGRPHGSFDLSAEVLASWAEFAAGDYQAAYDQYPSDPKLNQFNSNVTGAYWRYLALMHQGKREQAARLLNDPAFRVFGHWMVLENPWTIWPNAFEIAGAVAYLRGQIDETEMIASVKIDPEVESELVLPEKMCMAYFVIAEKLLLDGDRAKAEKFFRKAVYTHVIRTPAWIISNARLKHLSASER